MRDPPSNYIHNEAKSMLTSDLYKFNDGSSLSWTLGTPPNEATKYVPGESKDRSGNFVPLTTEELETVVIQSGFRIILPIDTSCCVGPPYSHTHVFDSPSTLREFLDVMYTFYNTNVLLMDYKWAKKVARNAVKSYKSGNFWKPEKSSPNLLIYLMGDHVFYEGISKDGYLSLGS